MNAMTATTAMSATTKSVPNILGPRSQHNNLSTVVAAKTSSFITDPTLTPNVFMSHDVDHEDNDDFRDFLFSYRSTIYNSVNPDRAYGVIVYDSRPLPHLAKMHVAKFGGLLRLLVPSRAVPVYDKDFALTHWSRAMLDLREAVDSWDEEDGEAPDSACIALLQQLVPVLQRRTRLPAINLEGDGSIALRWRKAEPVRSVCLMVTPSRIAAIIADGGADGGTVESITASGDVFTDKEYLRVERWVEMAISQPRFAEIAD